MRIYTHADCLLHEASDGHPERPDRLRHLLDVLRRSATLEDATFVDAPLAAPAVIERIHPSHYVATLEDLQPLTGLAYADPDTALCPHSLAAAQRAVGAVCSATEAVLNGDVTRAFCAVRPPGHHAETAAAMGFCLYNSVAVAARAALDSGLVERVCILDFDVHHGNGTVEIFLDDPRVLVCSSFQHPFYPSRFDDVVREHVVLTPLEAGTGGDQFRQRVSDSWFAKIAAHQPQLVFISAGFDAHRADPLAQLNLVEDDFQWLTEAIADIADTHADGRIVSTLEGGYDLNALAGSCHAHLEALTR